MLGGCINMEGLLRVEVTRVGRRQRAGPGDRADAGGGAGEAAVTRLLERYAGRYLVLVLMAAAGGWFAGGGMAALLAVLVASCPCALVLAAPATSIAAIAVAGRHGILVKGAAFLEDLATVNSVIVDKTGTVTLGELRLAGVVMADGSVQAGSVQAAPARAEALQQGPMQHGTVEHEAFEHGAFEHGALGHDAVGHGAVRDAAALAGAQAGWADRDRLVQVAATLGAASNHPVSRALAHLLPAEHRLPVTGVREVQGLGMLALLADGATVALGRPELFRQEGIAAPPPPEHDGPVSGVSEDGISSAGCCWPTSRGPRPVRPWTTCAAWAWPGRCC